MFRETLRDSKLFTLPPKSVTQRIKSDNVPKFQSLVTPSASAARRNWGLKFPVTGAKTKLIEFQSFEDRFASNGVSNVPRFTSKIKNLDALGAAVKLPQSRRLRSLYDFPSPVTAGSNQEKLPQRRKGLRNLSEPEFRKVVQRARLSPQSEPLTTEMLHKLGLGGEASSQQNNSFIPESRSDGPVQWQNSSIGASYASPGVLHNLPSGVVEQLRVKGRAMPGRAHKGAVAFGGFVATNHGGAVAQVPWFETQNLSVNSNINGSVSGDLHITVQTDTPSRHPIDSLTNV